MSKFYTLLIFLSTVLFFSCEKQEPQCYLSAPYVYVNGELYTGSAKYVEVLDNESITIGTSAVEGFSYKWTGPNGFESTLSKPVIADATNASSGIYTLTYSKGICSGTASVELTVIKTVIPCSPDQNKMVFNGGISTVNFTSSYNSGNSGYYKINAGSSNADLTLIFSNENAPQSGVYVIDPNNPKSPGTGEVAVTLNISGYYGEARKGDVYITKLASGKYKVIFCDLKFYTGYPAEVIGSTLINQDAL